MKPTQFTGKPLRTNAFTASQMKTSDKDRLQTEPPIIS